MCSSRTASPVTVCGAGKNRIKAVESSIFRESSGSNSVLIMALRGFGGDLLGQRASYT
jgi:hypothetical protein